MRTLTLREMAAVWGTHVTDITGPSSRYRVKAIGNKAQRNGYALYDADSTAAELLAKKRQQAEREEERAREALARAERYREVERRVQDWMEGQHD